MAESRLHKQFVRSIVSYLETIPYCCVDFIEADLDNYNTRTSRVVGGFYPDVFYKDSKTIIIGEAKTENDLINPHTQDQILSYIEEVKLFDGERHIVLCVPFIAFCSLFNYVNILIEKQNVKDVTFHLLSDNTNTEILCL